jgi:hypothetical protein
MRVHGGAHERHGSAHEEHGTSSGGAADAGSPLSATPVAACASKPSGMLV